MSDVLSLGIGMMLGGAAVLVMVAGRTAGVRTPNRHRKGRGK